MDCAYAWRISPLELMKAPLYEVARLCQHMNRIQKNLKAIKENAR